MFLICILFLPIHTKCELVLWNIGFLFKRYNYITKYVKTNVATNTLTHIHSKHNLDIRSQLHLSKLPKLKNAYIPHTTSKILLFLSIPSSTFYVNKIHTHTHTQYDIKLFIYHNCTKLHHPKTITHTRVSLQ